MHVPRARRGEIAEPRAKGDAARTGAEDVEIGRPGDLAGGIARFAERLDVGVEAPLRILPGRIAPAHAVGLHTLVERRAHEAVLRRQVEHVELVDLRRHDHERPAMNMGRRRCVLDELEHVVAEHDGPRRRREVFANGERTRIDLFRQPAAARNVVDEVGKAAQHARSLRRGELAQRGGVAGQRIGGRERVDQKRRRESGALRVQRVHVRVVDATVERGAERHVGLQKPLVPRVVGPRGVGEAAIAGRGRQRGTSGQDAREVARQFCGLLSDGAWLPREVRHESCRSTRDILAAHADQRIRGQRVLCCHFGDRGPFGGRRAGGIAPANRALDGDGVARHDFLCVSR